MLRVLNIRTAVPLNKPLKVWAARKLKCHVGDVIDVRIVRRSIDARHKPRIYFVFTLDVQLKN